MVVNQNIVKKLNFMIWISKKVLSETPNDFSLWQFFFTLKPIPKSGYCQYYQNLSNNSIEYK